MHKSSEKAKLPELPGRIYLAFIGLAGFLPASSLRWAINFRDETDSGLALGGFLFAIVVAMAGYFVYLWLRPHPVTFFLVLISLQNALPMGPGAHRGTMTREGFLRYAAILSIGQTAFLIGSMLLVDRFILRSLRRKALKLAASSLWDADADRPLATKGPF